MFEKKRFFDKDFLLSCGYVIGTAIGAGIFTLPFVFSKAGFFSSLLLMLFIGLIVIVCNLMYAEVTLRTRKKSRLIGYSDKYLGVWGKRISTFVSLFSFYSALLIYMIIGGTFLQAILSPFLGGNEFIYSIVIFILFAIAIHYNLKIFSLIESWMTGFLIFVILAVVIKCSFYIDYSNLLTYNSHNFMLPFGAILFSLGSMSAIPELEQIVKGKKDKIKDIVIVSNIAYIVLYILFIIAVLGVTGGNTTEEAFMGLNEAIGNGVVLTGFVFGVLAIFTSYLTNGMSLKETFEYDYGFGKNKAWFLTCIVPLVFFVLGFRDFISIISIVGAVTGGIWGILVILIFYKAKLRGDVEPEFEFDFPKIMSYIIVATFIFGVFYQLKYSI